MELPECLMLLLSACSSVLLPPVCICAPAKKEGHKPHALRTSLTGDLRLEVRSKQMGCRLIGGRERATRGGEERGQGQGQGRRVQCRVKRKLFAQPLPEDGEVN
eukprot:765252-Hanusia_phi.AAC.2